MSNNLITNRTKYNRDYFTSYQFNDANGNLKIPHLYRLMQETASLQLYEYYDSLEYIKSLDRAYMILKIDIAFYDTVKSYENITVSSWGRENGLAKMLRNYTVKRKNGELIAEANSLWAYVDLNRRRPVKISEIPHQMEICEDDVNADAKFKIILPDDMAYVGEKKVIFSDTDLYGHMNNACYVDLICDILPLDRQFLSHLRIEFVSECRIGTVIKIKACEKDNIVYISGEKEDGVVAFNAEATLIHKD